MVAKSVGDGRVFIEIGSTLRVTREARGSTCVVTVLASDGFELPVMHHLVFFCKGKGCH